MKLYILNLEDRSLEEPGGCRALVVRAEDKIAARAIAQSEGGVGADIWTMPESTSCELLEVDGPRGVIVKDHWPE